VSGAARGTTARQLSVIVDGTVEVSPGGEGFSVVRAPSLLCALVTVQERGGPLCSVLIDARGVSGDACSGCARRSVAGSRPMRLGE